MAEQASLPILSKNYLCNTCQITCKDVQEQRTHMKDAWHVHNIKLRVESLPPVSLETFITEIQGKNVGRKAVKASQGSRSSSSNDEEESDIESASDEGEDQSSWSFQCLFCNYVFEENDTGFAMNLEHMTADHGMIIPDPEMVVSLQSFIGYLATEIREWHECLYCGATKPSTSSIQSHMRDKRHCQLNFDREPELLDFWDGLRSSGESDGTSDQGPLRDRPVNISSTEMRFASGKVIGSKKFVSATRRATRKRSPAALPPATEPEEATEAPQVVTESSLSTLNLGAQRPAGRQLAVREEMGLTGVTLQQRQALVLAEKKAQRSEAMARRAREWVYAKGGNEQKYDLLDTKMKMGRQNHKLLPR